LVSLLVRTGLYSFPTHSTPVGAPCVLIIHCCIGANKVLKLFLDMLFGFCIGYSFLSKWTLVPLSYVNDEHNEMKSWQSTFSLHLVSLRFLSGSGNTYLMKPMKPQLREVAC